ncbi:hypothetical protein TGAMA5MH_04589 [Trichoderma gamsii]|uniref:von Willebrand factor type A domain-containing protein n=1 Tax=Trichoderma gamsii TaxID=398673 RepID=A0A2K0TDN7_9HYPO|nr:hypothetical protein TGAMA5MH_04589 [Trichoderma gamsii]
MENADVYSIFPHHQETTQTRSHSQQTLADDSALVPILPSEGHIIFCLPIISVSTDVSVDGTISLTNLTQNFYNPSKDAIAEARHTFPLYHGAVVTSFECIVGDSRRLRGVVKPTSEARTEFEVSRTRMKVAALLEEQTPEIFETSLGNIPGEATVKVSLTYVHELKVVTSKEEKSECLALIIPASIAPRYVAAETPTPSPDVLGDKLEINIRILDDGSIDPVSSHIESKHRTTRYEGLKPSSGVPITNIAELHSLNSATSSAQKLQHMWRYSSKSQPDLKEDFVFVIQMLERTRLQSRAVITPANDMGHAALMVSLRPNDLFGSAVRPELFKGEIIFVLDCSDSMSWTESEDERPKMETTKEAMFLALRGLPSTCNFNIISFGSEVRGMWQKSQKAIDSKNLSHGSKYLATIEANMEGTEVLLALKGAVGTRDPRCPSTQIILVTDGEFHSEPHKPILEYVRETRQKVGKKIRFFTLGIGEGVSHSVVEGIAELGGGYCDVVDVAKKPGWEDRLNRMVRSAMEPDEWTCDIDLGPGYERRSLADYTFGVDDEADTDLTVYAQGPHPIPSLPPFRYKSFFFLLDMRNNESPTTITIKTTSDAAKKKLFTMEVKMAQLAENPIHPLAVKTILRSLEEEVKRADADVNRARVNAEILGTKYTISSKWTSFVALADKSMEQECQIEVYKSPLRQISISELWLPEDEETSDIESEFTLEQVSANDYALMSTRSIHQHHVEQLQEKIFDTESFDPGKSGRTKIPTIDKGKGPVAAIATSLNLNTPNRTRAGLADFAGEKSLTSFLQQNEASPTGFSRFE